MRFKFITSSDPLVGKVIELGKKNSGTLGIMPRDAYIEQAKLNVWWLLTMVIILSHIAFFELHGKTGGLQLRNCP